MGEIKHWKMNVGFPIPSASQTELQYTCLEKDFDKFVKKCHDTRQFYVGVVRDLEFENKKWSQSFKQTFAPAYAMGRARRNDANIGNAFGSSRIVRTTAGKLQRAFAILGIRRLPGTVASVFRDVLVQHAAFQEHATKQRR